MSGLPDGEPGPPELAEGRAEGQRWFGGEAADAGQCPWSQPGRRREERVGYGDVGTMMTPFMC